MAKRTVKSVKKYTMVVPRTSRIDKAVERAKAQGAKPGAAKRSRAAIQSHRNRKLPGFEALHPRKTNGEFRNK